MLSDFIKDCTVYDLSEDIIVNTIDIRKKYKLKLGDAIIAVTAILNELELLTRNVNDFNKVSELKVVNPHLL